MNGDDVRRRFKFQTFPLDQSIDLLRLSLFQLVGNPEDLDLFVDGLKDKITNEISLLLEVTGDEASNEEKEQQLR